jgi:hypothetical protein
MFMLNKVGRYICEDPRAAFQRNRVVVKGSLLLLWREKEEDFLKRRRTARHVVHWSIGPKLISSHYARRPARGLSLSVGI